MISISLIPKLILVSLFLEVNSQTPAKTFKQCLDHTTTDGCDRVWDQVFNGNICVSTFTLLMSHNLLSIFPNTYSDTGFEQITTNRTGLFSSNSVPRVGQIIKLMATIFKIMRLNTMHSCWFWNIGSTDRAFLISN